MRYTEQSSIIRGAREAARDPSSGRAWVCMLLTISLVFILSCGDDNGGGILPPDPADISWVDINGDRVGPISAIATDPSGAVFATSRRGGVFRSTDGGGSWSTVNAGLANDLIQCIAIKNTGSIFVGTYGEGIYRSTDGGSSWSEVNGGLPQTTVSGIAVDQTGCIFIATYGHGLFRSADDGESWEEVAGGSFSIHEFVSDLAAAPTGALFAAFYEGGMYRSTDGGAVWTLVKRGFQIDPGGREYEAKHLAFDPAGNIYVFTYEPGGVFISRDGGDGWEPFEVEGIDGAVGDILFSPTGYRYARGGEDHVYRSLPGESWEPFNTGVRNVTPIVLAIGPDDWIFCGTSYGLLFRCSGEAGIWRQVNDVLPDEGASEVFAAAGGTVLINSMGRCYRSVDRGTTWKPSGEGMGGYASCFTGNTRGVIFAGTTRAGVFRSDDDGRTWSAANSGMESSEIRDIAVDGTGNVYAAAFGEGVFRSGDNGGSWELLAQDLSTPKVMALAVSGTGTVFAGTAHGGVFRLYAGSTRWDQINEGLTNLVVWNLAVVPPFRVFAATSNGVFVSHDGGDRWRPIQGGMTSPCVKVLAVNGAGHLYSSARCPGSIFGGVFRLVDVNGKWESVGEGLPEYVYGMSFDRGGYLFAGTDDGMFRTAVPTCTR